MAELDRIVARIEADTSQFVSELRKAQAATKGFRDDSRTAFDRAGDAAAGFVKNLVSVRSALALAAGATGLFYFNVRMIEAADNIAKTSQRIGVATDKLQELHYAAKLSGASTEEMDTALRFLNRNLGDAARGQGEARHILEQLGLVGLDAHAAFMKLSDVFASSSDQAAKTTLAMQLLGRGGAGVINVLSEGQTELQKMAARAHELGIVMSEDMLKRAEQANDELDEMFMIFKKIGMNVAMEFLPVMRQVAAVVSSPEFVAGAKSAAESLGGLINLITTNAEVITRVLGAMAGLAVFSRLGPAGAAGGALLGLAGPEVLELLGKLGAVKETIKEIGDVAEVSAEDAKELADELQRILRDAPVNKFSEDLEKQSSIIQGWIAAVGAGASSVEDATRSMEIQNEALSKNIDLSTEAGSRWHEFQFQNKLLAETQKEVAAVIEATKTEQEKLNEALRKLEDLKPHLPAEAYQRRIEQLVPHLRRMTEAAEEMGQTIAGAFENAVFSGEKLSVTLQNLANDLMRIMFRKTVTEPLGDFMTQGLKGAFGLSSAHGNVFSGPVRPFAKGGVVTKPATFPMARGVGLMGERGAEAIMPLRRTRGGDLGVRAEMGGGGGTIVNVYAPPGSQVRQERESGGDTERINVFIDSMTADSVRQPGSKTHRAIRDTFGVSQQGINR